jgi:hypothetical protein
MARDHFKQSMFAPNFVADNREENRKLAKERRFKKTPNVLLRAFRAIRQLWVSK